MSESNTGVPQAMLTQQRAERPAWLIDQCAAADAPHIARLGKGGWEPFSVHTGPDAVPRIWWRKREW